jgi:hypothetical protein
VRVFVFAALAVLACSSAPSGAPPAFCASDPRVESFTLGMDSVGTDGAAFSITSANPSVVQQGLNDWTVNVHDTSGAPVDGTLTITPFMPDHGHGAPTIATITPKGDGSYDVSGINLSMRGVWQITITIASATVNDSAVFTFCVDGAS